MLWELADAWPQLSSASVAGQKCSAMTNLHTLSNTYWAFLGAGMWWMWKVVLVDTKKIRQRMEFLVCTTPYGDATVSFLTFENIVPCAKKKPQTTQNPKTTNKPTSKQKRILRKYFWKSHTRLHSCKPLTSFLMGQRFPLAGELMFFQLYLLKKEEKIVVQKSGIKRKSYSQILPEQCNTTCICNRKLNNHAYFQQLYYLNWFI